ncbi:hypothetical protein [Caulobacter segnis]|uniref:Uncharacterized protein n=1 Tax=Caulobacter segnis TaxID=88688 RepID=A0A2W5VD53_9CAUL|nr:hypothetical protein [Caulobacter segnis]PZR35793.1 MAG: hypothetical protein DI526_05760 [Caulobacter segnis]
MNLAKTVSALILQARVMPDAKRAASLLEQRARLFEGTPVRRWPQGVTAVDVNLAVSDLFRAARDLREEAGLRPLAA